MSLISEIMSPLSKDHCMIFYYLGFICFFFKYNYNMFHNNNIF